MVVVVVVENGVGKKQRKEAAAVMVTMHEDVDEMPLSYYLIIRGKATHHPLSTASWHYQSQLPTLASASDP